MLMVITTNQRDIPNVTGEPRSRSARQVRSSWRDDWDRCALAPGWAIVNFRKLKTQPQRLRFSSRFAGQFRLFLVRLVSFFGRELAISVFFLFQTGEFDFSWFGYWRRRFLDKFCFAQRPRSATTPAGAVRA